MSIPKLKVIVVALLGGGLAVAVYNSLEEFLAGLGESDW